jgi:hypothetical protein
MAVGTTRSLAAVPPRRFLKLLAAAGSGWVRRC